MNLCRKFILASVRKTNNGINKFKLFQQNVPAHQAHDVRTMDVKTLKRRPIDILLTSRAEGICLVIQNKQRMRYSIPLKHKITERYIMIQEILY